MKVVRVANGQGFWGDSVDAPIHLLEGGPVDYLGMDYLAEVTLSIMTRQKLKNPAVGYATDFLDFVRRALPQLVAKIVKVVTNAGGLVHFLFAWPSAQIAVMGGEQAAKTLLSIQLKNRSDEVGEEERRERLADIEKRYADAMNPRYAAARLWVDGIIDPRQTRGVVARCLEACAANPELPEFRTGVLQT